jgi:hypothetical protein
MFAKRVGPKGMYVFRIADGDVAAHAFGVAFAGEDAEGACHMLQHVAAVGVKGDVFGDAGEADALADCFEGGLFFLFDGKAGVLWFAGCDGHCGGWRR